MDKAQIINALALLNPALDEHWTSDGLPRVDVIGGLLGADKMTRSTITEAAPEFTREVARSIGTGEAINTPAASTVIKPNPKVDATENVQETLNVVAPPLGVYVLDFLTSDGKNIDLDDLLEQFGDGSEKTNEEKLFDFQAMMKNLNDASEVWKSRADECSGYALKCVKISKQVQLKINDFAVGGLNAQQISNQLYLQGQQKMREERGALVLATGVLQVAPVDYVAPRPRSRYAVPKT